MSNHRPIAASAGYRMTVGTPILLDARQSRDPDRGDTLSKIKWVIETGLGDRVTIETNDQLVPFCWWQPGQYTARLTVTDAHGVTSRAVTVPIRVDAAPDPTPDPVPTWTRGVTFDGSRWWVSDTGFPIENTYYTARPAGVIDGVRVADGRLLAHGVDGVIYQWDAATATWPVDGARPTPAPDPLPDPGPPTPAPPPVVSPPPAPVPVPPGPTPAVLQPSQLRYLGVIRPPLANPWSEPAGTRFGFSNGALAVRRVNGAPHLFLCGAKPSGDPIYEITAPEPSRDPAVVTRADLVAAWGDGYQGRRQVQAGQVGMTTRGLLWLDEALYWAYGNEYNVAGQHDPSLGRTRFAGQTLTAEGAWRTQAPSQQTRGYLVEIPAWFAAAYTGGHRLGLGAPITSGNASSPWGSMLTVTDVPPADAAPDALASGWSRACQTLITHGLTQRQPREANYRHCGWTVPYDSAQGGYTSPGDPVFTSMDVISAAAWVDTPAVAALLHVGQLATSLPGDVFADGDTQIHQWYGPNVCPHGHDGGPVSVSVGDAASSSVPTLWAYDPADLARVAQGQLAPDAIRPAWTIPLVELIPSQRRAHDLYQIGGAAWDPVDRRLYLTEIQAVREAGEPRPLIHVIEVA